MDLVDPRPHQSSVARPNRLKEGSGRLDDSRVLCPGDSPIVNDPLGDT